MVHSEGLLRCTMTLLQRSGFAQPNGHRIIDPNKLKSDTYQSCFIENILNVLPHLKQQLSNKSFNNYIIVIEYYFVRLVLQ